MRATRTSSRNDRVPAPTQLCRPGLRHRLAGRWLGPLLDARIAGGESTDADRALTERARRLIDPSHRDRLARDLAAAAAAPASRTTWNARIPVDRRAVAEAQFEITRLLAALRTSGPVEARGVALTARLLTEGRGPLYAGPGRRLIAATEEATAALWPRPVVGEVTPRAFGSR